jgi:hypothetical protein
MENSAKVTNPEVAFQQVRELVASGNKVTVVYIVKGKKRYWKLKWKFHPGEM